MKEQRFIYELLPIDFWNGWIPLSTAMDDPTKYGVGSDYPGDYENSNEGDQEGFRKNLRVKVDEAKFLITKHTSWEGDGSVYIAAMPGLDNGGGQSHLVFAIKQGNNGTTFIVSPFPYIHLQEALTATVSVNAYPPFRVNSASDSDELPF